LAEVPVPPSQDSFRDEPELLDVPDEPLSELALVPAAPTAGIDRVLRGEDGVTGAAGVGVGVGVGGDAGADAGAGVEGADEEP